VLVAVGAQHTVRYDVGGFGVGATALRTVTRIMDDFGAESIRVAETIARLESDAEEIRERAAVEWRHELELLDAESELATINATLSGAAARELVAA